MELDILDYYKKLVDFLGEVLGKNAEVVLRDCRKPDHDIIAIANGHVSGRTIGAPITDFTLSILANEEWKERDYVVNYEGKAAPDKRLRSSTYFIREEGKLVGQLCVNIDMTPYEQVMDSIRQLSGMELMSDGGKSGIICSGPVENFSEDVMGDMMNRAGLFQLKGAVGAVAEYLYCSEASVYRYQSKIQRKA